MLRSAVVTAVEKVVGKDNVDVFFNNNLPRALDQAVIESVRSGLYLEDKVLMVTLQKALTSLESDGYWEN